MCERDSARAPQECEGGDEDVVCVMRCSDFFDSMSKYIQGMQGVGLCILETTRRGGRSVRLVCVRYTPKVVPDRVSDAVLTPPDHGYTIPHGNIHR